MPNQPIGLFPIPIFRLLWQSHLLYKINCTYYYYIHNNIFYLQNQVFALKWLSRNTFQSVLFNYTNFKLKFDFLLVLDLLNLFLKIKNLTVLSLKLLTLKKLKTLFLYLPSCALLLYSLLLDTLLILFILVHPILFIYFLWFT